MPDDVELPTPTVGLYFGGMELHANAQFVRRYFGRKVALLYLKVQRQTAVLYLEDRAGFSVRETDGLSEPDMAKEAARLRLALIDKLAQHMRDS